MSNDYSLDKDRLYFTQCNDTIYLRCPVCTNEKKVLRHCKLHKNFPSLWYHVRKDHTDIPPGEFEEIIQIFTGVFKAFKRQMLPTWAYSELKNDHTTTSSSVLITGRPPRIDSWKKITEIAKLLKIQSELYPFFKPKQLKAFIKVITGPADSRTIKKYFDCVTNYSKKDMINGVYDISEFCNKIGV